MWQTVLLWVKHSARPAQLRSKGAPMKAALAGLTVPDESPEGWEALLLVSEAQR
jgi:hypothetical protein